MAAAAEVVDISTDPIEMRQRRRRLLVRVGVPIVGVVLMMAAILAMALYSHTANRQGALALSDELLQTLEGRVSAVVSSYLDPPARFVRIDRAIVGDDPTGANLPLAESAAIGALREIPQVANLSFADGAGNFMLVRRGPNGGFDTKVIRNDPLPRRVTWIHRDADGEEIGRETDPSDTYDPRERPWFDGALGTEELFWTGVYTFFTDQVPGVTVSLRHLADDGRIYVFGADITLEALSAFLSDLEISANGRAVIIDHDGRLIASPKGFAVLEQGGDKAEAPELGDPVMARAYDQFRTEGPGHRTIDVGGVRYVTAVMPIPAAAQDWLVVMTAPESDFVGFVATNSRRALFVSLAVVAVAAFLAVLLVRQGLRADRTVRQLHERERAISRESEAFSTLASDVSLFDPARGEAPRALTETLAEIVQARRASVWRLSGAKRFLRCEDSYDRETGGHVEGLELHRDELPQFFAHLLKGEEIDTPDAASDRRTAELHRIVMSPLGSKALLVVPVRHDDDVVGAVWLEDAARTTAVLDFIRGAATMLAPRLVEAGPPTKAATKAAAPAARPTAATPAPPARNFTAELARRGIDPEAIEGDIYADVAVMVVHFSDPTAMSVRTSDSAQSLSNQVACALQETAHKNGIPYLKIVGQNVIAAAGLDEGAAAGEVRIAEAALAVRDQCLALFEDSDYRHEFRIGIDCGAAIGTTIGSKPQVFNLAGEAVRLAETMAASAVPGTIQATEAAYEKLRQHYLFRPRGTFYLPRVGDSRLFVLAGHL